MCVCVCVRADAYVCFRACVGVGARALVCVCVRVASMQRATISPSEAYLATPHFSTLSNNRHDFRKKVIEHKIRILIISTTFIRGVSHSNNNSARYCHKCENFSM